MSKKTIIILDGKANGYEQVALKLIGELARDPKIKKIFEELIDDESISRREVFATAFVFGVSAAIDAMRAGKIKTFPTG